jgi:hypothetical protein
MSGLQAPGFILGDRDCCQELNRRRGPRIPGLWLERRGIAQPPTGGLQTRNLDMRTHVYTVTFPASTVSEEGHPNCDEALG